MADLASVLLKINDIEVSPDAPQSEALNAKIGSNINALIDADEATDSRLDALEGDLGGKISFELVTTINNVAYPCELTIVYKPSGGLNGAFLRSTPAAGGTPTDYLFATSSGQFPPFVWRTNLTGVSPGFQVDILRLVA